jgi:hypothetical protein
VIHYACDATPAPKLFHLSVRGPKGEESLTLPRIHPTWSLSKAPMAEASTDLMTRWWPPTNFSRTLPVSWLLYRAVQMLHAC